MQHIGADKWINAFSPGIPHVASVSLGETFEVDTMDAYGGQIHSPEILRTEIDMELFDTATGPIRIDGVRAGDVLAVHIEEIRLGTWGVMAVRPGIGLAGDLIDSVTTMIIPVDGDGAHLPGGPTVPLRPMVGVLGVARHDEAIRAHTPGDHAANLDTTCLTSGAALIVRAQEDGAGLAVGDLHAVMGDGELGGTGVEIHGSVLLRVARYPHDPCGRWPLVAAHDGLYVHASLPRFEDAAAEAFRQAVLLVQREQRLELEVAYRLASIVCDAEVAQLVNETRTARVRIPWEWVPALRP